MTRASSVWTIRTSFSIQTIHILTQVQCLSVSRQYMVLMADDQPVFFMKCKSYTKYELSKRYQIPFIYQGSVGINLCRSCSCARKSPSFASTLVMNHACCFVHLGTPQRKIRPLPSWVSTGSSAAAAWCHFPASLPRRHRQLLCWWVACQLLREFDGGNDLAPILWDWFPLQSSVREGSCQWSSRGALRRSCRHHLLWMVYSHIHIMNNTGLGLKYKHNDE